MIGRTCGVPFFADVRELDRSLWRILLTVPTGGVAAVLAAIAVFVIALAFLAAAYFTGTLTDGIVSLDSLRDLPERVQDAEAIGHDLGASVALLSMIALVNAAMAVAFVAAACALHHRGFRTYLTSARHFRWSLVLGGAVLYGLLLWPFLTFENWDNIGRGAFPLQEIDDTASGRLTYLFAAIGLLFLAALAEELVFRGWMMRHVMALTGKPWIALTLSAVLFSLVHFDPNLDAFVARLVMGLGFGYMALRLGGVEFATGAHLSHNLVIILFMEPMTLNAATPHDLAPTFVPEIVVLGLAYGLLPELVLRVPMLRRLMQLDPEPIRA